MDTCLLCGNPFPPEGHECEHTKEYADMFKLNKIKRHKQVKQVLNNRYEFEYCKASDVGKLEKENERLLQEVKVFQDRLAGNNKALDFWQKKYLQSLDNEIDKDILITEIMERMEHKENCMFWVEENINECDCGHNELIQRAKDITDGE